MEKMLEVLARAAKERERATARMEKVTAMVRDLAMERERVVVKAKADRAAVARLLEPRRPAPQQTPETPEDE